MVNIFIVHSGKNYDQAQIIRQQLEGLRDENNKLLVSPEMSHANVLILENGGMFWKVDAKKLIKQAQLILFIQGETSAASPYIQWEIETAQKLHKEIILYKLSPSLETPDWLIKPDHFSGLKKIQAKEINTITEIKNRIRSYDLGEYNVFTDDINNIFDDPSRKQELFEQYKLYQETSEALVSRRQNVSNFFLSINSAITGLLGIVLALNIALSNMMLMLATLSFIGIILNISWTNLLEAYGTLNSSKMKVIRLIEQKLPISLYDSEWEIMSDKLNSKKYRSFTESEKKIPRIFSFIYIITIIISILIFVLQWFS